jgi:glutathione S-transferase
LDHNFFDCGGDSVTLIALLAELAQRFERRFTTVDMLRFPTVATFARHIIEEAGAIRQDLPAVERRAEHQSARLAGLRRRVKNARSWTSMEQLSKAD